MKNICTLLVLVFSSITVNAQAPNWAWANSAGGTQHDYNKSSTTDLSGNTYVTGWYLSSSITFGAITLTNNSLASSIFIVKYDASGNVLWAKSAGGTGSVLGYSIATDASGNVYVTGSYGSPFITFGTDTLTTPNNSPDIFIVKYDSSGNELWAKRAGGNGIDQGYGITTDTFGNIYVTGYYSDFMILGTDSLSIGGENFFIAKFDALGNEVWARSGDCPSTNRCWSVTTDVSGNVYVTGEYGSTYLSFGADTIVNTNGFGYDIFIVKYDSSGNVLWARGVGGNSGQYYGYSISADPFGSVYVTGSWIGSSLIFGTDTLNNVGSGDIFILKYDALGNALWVEGAGSFGNDVGNSTTSDAAGNVYVTGYYSYSITFGPITLNSAGGNDIFIVKYDASGNVVWARSEGDLLNDECESINIDVLGNLYLTGSYYSQSLTLGGTVLTNTSNYADMFVAKLDATLVSVVEKKSVRKELVIYPNPSNGIFNFKDTKNLKQVEVYNLLGEQILAQCNQKQINLSGFAKGIYYARINGEVLVKLVKD
jgi:hypothetical protein